MRLFSRSTSRTVCVNGGTVLVDSGRITVVRTSEDDDGEIEATHTTDGNGTLVMPGVVNAHIHLELMPLIGAFSDFDLLEMMGSMTAIYGRLGSLWSQYPQLDASEGEQELVTSALAGNGNSTTRPAVAQRTLITAVEDDRDLESMGRDKLPSTTE